MNGVWLARLDLLRLQLNFRKRHYLWSHLLFLIVLYKAPVWIFCFVNENFQPIDTKMMYSNPTISYFTCSKQLLSVLNIQSRPDSSASSFCNQSPSLFYTWNCPAINPDTDHFKKDWGLFKQWHAYPLKSQLILHDVSNKRNIKPLPIWKTTNWHLKKYA